MTVNPNHEEPTDMTEPFHVVAATSELEDGGQMHIELDGREILLCRYEGEFYAIDYYCSHEEFALEGGEIADGCITCPYHGAMFCLKTGAVAAPPAWEAIATYPVKVENDTVAVSIRPASCADADSA